MIEITTCLKTSREIVWVSNILAVIYAQYRGFENHEDTFFVVSAQHLCRGEGTLLALLISVRVLMVSKLVHTWTRVKYEGNILAGKGEYSMIQRCMYTCSVDEELSPAVLHVQLSLFVIRSTQYSVRVHVRCTRSPTAALRHGYHRYESTKVLSYLFYLRRYGSIILPYN